MATYEKTNQDSIKALFNNIAKRYDVVNNVMSLSMHKRWNQKLINLVLASQRPQTYLDLCCGTGAIAHTYLQQVSPVPTVYMLDFSEEMLASAKASATKLSLPLDHLHYLQADAQDIPLAKESVSCATVAYGIRNVASPKKCIEEVYRVLKPGGTFGILELTVPNNKLMRLGHRIYLRTVLPLVGKLFTSNKEAYQYLCESIKTFIAPQALQTMMQDAGFANIQLHPLTSGTATIIVGKKPS